MAVSRFDISDAAGNKVWCVHGIGSDTLTIRTTGGQPVTLDHVSVEQLREWLQLNQPGIPPF